MALRYASGYAIDHSVGVGVAARRVNFEYRVVSFVCASVRFGGFHRRVGFDQCGGWYGVANISYVVKVHSMCPYSESDAAHNSTLNGGVNPLRPTFDMKVFHGEHECHSFNTWIMWATPFRLDGAIFGIRVRIVPVAVQAAYGAR